MQLPPNILQQHQTTLDNIELVVTGVGDSGVAAFEMLERLQAIKDEAESTAYDKLRKTKAGTSVRAATNATNSQATQLSISQIAHKLPREMLTLTLSDGIQELSAIELDKLDDFSLATPIGTKVSIRNAKIKRGILHLKPPNIRIISCPPQTISPDEFIKSLSRLFEATLAQRNASNHLYPEDTLPPSPKFQTNNNFSTFESAFSADNDNCGPGGGATRGGKGRGSRGGKSGRAAPSKASRGNKTASRGRDASRGRGNNRFASSPPFPPDSTVQQFNGFQQHEILPQQQCLPQASIINPRNYSTNAYPENVSPSFSDDDDEEMGEALLQWEIQTNAQGQQMRPRNSIGLAPNFSSDEFDLDGEDDEMLQAIALEEIYEHTMHGIVSATDIGEREGIRDEKEDFTNHETDFPSFLSTVSPDFSGRLVVHAIFQDVRMEVSSRRFVVVIEDGTDLLQCIMSEKLGPGWNDFQALSQWKQTLMLREYSIQLDFSERPPHITNILEIK
ncbi:hypothetical protein BDR26DRAFT_852087 [Obelidium mucronatum]|nr:hypothetical protein BDR26DRAFT_852087 [Obelidium mucronatum]